MYRYIIICTIFMMIMNCGGTPVPSTVRPEKNESISPTSSIPSALENESCGSTTPCQKEDDSDQTTRARKPSDED